MSATLYSTLTPHFPVNMVQWPGGNVYMANGVDSVLKWNGFRSDAVTVGLETPASAVTIAASGVGTITGTYKAYLRFVDEDGFYSPLSAISGSASASSSLNIDYTNVATPASARIKRRQILRNTDGQYSVFYVDIDSTDVSGSTFQSDKTDDVLAAQDAVPLYDTEGNLLTDQWAAPRSDKPVIAYHRGIMFLAGEQAYKYGNVTVTNGSPTVTGIGTAWGSALDDREVWIVGDDEVYTISSINTTTQVITLTGNFTGTTNTFAQYAIRPPTAQRSTIYYSEPGNPEGWRELAGLKLEAASSAIVAMISAPAAMYLCTEREMFRFTFDTSPDTDGRADFAATRGCVNARSWVRVLDSFYILDLAGIYRMMDGQTQESATRVLDLWSQESVGDYKINWAYRQYFHAVHDREDSTVRFFVTIGSGKPRHAICHNYANEDWWLEAYPFEIGCSVDWQTFRHRCMLGGLGITLYEQGVGTLDGLNPEGYRVLGTVTSATQTSIVDNTLSLPSSAVAGSPIAIVSGRGKGQLRIIDSVSSTTIRVTQPWLITPDSTSKYQVGAISYRVKTGWLRYPKSADEQPMTLTFRPLTAGVLNVQRYVDHSVTPDEWSIDRPMFSMDGDGVSYAKDDSNIVVDLTRKVGYVMVHMGGLDTPMNRIGNYFMLELNGFSSRDTMVIHSASWGSH